MATFGDSYCGIYCGACSILVHSRTGRSDRFIDCCPKLPEGELACGGCKSDTVYTACRGCPLRNCSVGKGIEHCVDCTDYPCKDYKAWSSASRLLSHIKEAPGSLEAIKRGGTDGWAEAQIKRWSCSDCGTPFSWYAKVCSKCGRSLSAQAHALSGLKKLVCRIVLPLAYKRAKRKISGG
ncbi:DUF3795 domain-containing protein [bacterium]|nr:MAG: DUF3795 domain-containing protein [bacterium]